MTTTRKVYDFPLDKVEGQLVSYLKRRRYESTVADMIAGTGLPKYQVEQGIKAVLDEYAGSLKVTESGELLYHFPSGMRNKTKGFGPALKRFWKSFVKGAARVLSFLFKVWIVVMLVGYFLIFLAIMILAVVAAFAGSAAGRGRDSRSRGRGDGFGAMFLVIRLLDFALRMWFYSSILDSIQGNRRQRKPGERPFYKSVFGFVFGEGDPNTDWETKEKTYVISYIRSKRGVITLDELMALTGKEGEEAQRMVNRYLLEFEGEPGVTDNGTLIYSFPELLRTTAGEQKSFGSVPLHSPVEKKTAPFSANKPKTNRWIVFLNTFNLLFGSLFLLFPFTPGMAIVNAHVNLSKVATDAVTFLYATAHNLLSYLGMGNPTGFLSVALGIVPVSFAVFFFFIPLIRKIRQGRQNQAIREENLKKAVYSHILSNPDHVDPRAIQPDDADSTPKRLEAVRKRIVDRFAALKSADPVQLPDGSFVYRFPEIQRETADVEEYRRKVNLSSFEVGKTIFDSGQ